MSSWVSRWTPSFSAFAWAAFNLTSASCSTAPSDVLGLPLGGIGGRAFENFLTGIEGDFTERAFVGCGIVADDTGFA